jgi:hypothetical protein
MDPRIDLDDIETTLPGLELPPGSPARSQSLYRLSLENHTNALAVNLLDNSRTTHRSNSTRQTWVQPQYKNLNDT